jgi:uncharacterized repeat protein (TIGR03803 family)
VLATDGNFYGTTAIGGAGAGTVFKVSPGGTFTSLSQFTQNAQGYEPNSLIQGSDGNFYGTTIGGGTSGQGTIFKMLPDGTRTLLTAFTGGTTGNARGAGLNGLEEAGDGNFYGVTRSEGANGYGTIYRITPGGAVTTVKDFTGSSGACTADGLTTTGLTWPGVETSPFRMRDVNAQKLDLRRGCIRGIFAVRKECSPACQW